MIFPWDRKAKELAENMIDPNVLFAWPFARVLAVFFADAFGPQVMTDAEVLQRINRKRAEKGEPALTELPSQRAKNGRR